MRVLIIGGGLSGLFLATLLLKGGVYVDIIEEHSSIGRPQHCAGVVSENVIRLLRRVLGTDVRDVIVNRVNALRLVISGQFNRLFTETRCVYIINREVLEQLLASLVLSAGGKITLRCKARIEKCNGGLRFHVGGIEESTYDYIVFACGARVAMLRKGVKNIYPSYQIDICYSLSENAIEIYVDKTLNPHFFMWTIPLYGNIARVGTAGKNPRLILKEYLRRKGLYRVKMRDEYIGHVILTGPITPFQHGKYVFIGDAAGQNKITTGGGIFYSLSAAIALSKCLLRNDLSKYQDYWLDLFKRELMFQRLFRRIFLCLNNGLLGFVVRVADKTNYVSTFLRLGDVDHHGTGLLEAFKHYIKLL